MSSITASMLVAFIITFAFLAIFLYILAHIAGSNFSKAPMTRGMNGFEGKTLNLSCPQGRVISFANKNKYTTRGALICTGTSELDAFYNPSGQYENFFAGTYVDVFKEQGYELSKCEGKNKCSWTIPTEVEKLKKCNGKIAFIGTYDCLSK